MNVPRLNDEITKAGAQQALREYKAHRAMYDERDWEIEKIYRQIAKGNIVISVSAAIAAAGVDDLGLPRLAMARADCQRVRLSQLANERCVFGDWTHRSRWSFEASVPGIRSSGAAELPRIPPQHRPAASKLNRYWILWEADWKAIPRDPFLLRRIGKDAWIVCAAWDLTDVELSVLRAHA